MKKIILIVAVLISSSSLKAEIFGTAGTLKPGVMMFGVEPQVDIAPGDVTGFFHFGIGLLKRMDVNFEVGAGTAPNYAGGQLEYQFVKSDPIDFSLSFGPHYQRAAFLDLTPNFSHRFEHFALSTGPDLQWQVTRVKYLSVSWFFGASIPVLRNVEALFDIGVQMKGNKNWISGGLATYF